MSDERTLADILDGLAAKALAADEPDQDTTMQIGAALEAAVTGEPTPAAEIQEVLGAALQALQAIYEGTLADPAKAMNAVATLIADAASALREPELAESSGTALAELRSILSGEDSTEAGEPNPAPSAAEAGQGPESSHEPAETADMEDPADNGGQPEGQTPAEPSASQPEGSEVGVPRLPSDADAALLGEFVVECLDHISAAEAALLELESDPDNGEPVNTIFRAFHTIKGTSGFLGLDRIQTLAHLAENLLDRAREGEIRVVGGYADLALNSCDALRTMIRDLEGIQPGGPLPMPPDFEDLVDRLRDPEAAGIGLEADDAPMRTGDILVAQNKARREDIEAAIAAHGGRRIGEALVAQGVASAATVAQALRTQKRQQGKSGDSSVRVATDRLDKLIDAVGELVIAQSMVSQDPVVTEGASPQLARNVAHAGKIVRELQDMSMSLRMVPLKATFGKMARLVRDLSRKAGKTVRFATEGEDTEIDRNMVEVLNDPLVHMMRNAVDHGVETPEARAAAGKEAEARVSLQAYHAGGNVVIELSDDGKGLDRQKIIAKAADRGLIQGDEKLSDSEAFGLIFQPGFSTAEQVTDISGRGVGMDVVRRGIESLRGHVEIASRPGEGSTFRIFLPLTMAITDAMLVRVGAERYLLPTMSIERSFRPESGAVSTVTQRGEMVSVRGELLPVFRLHRLFEVPEAETDPQKALLMIIENQGARCALLVDELLGQQQVVIKSLGQTLGQIPGVSGGAILGDGQVGLILDAGGLLNLADGHAKTDGGPMAA